MTKNGGIMDTKALIEKQLEEMSKHKWIESEKAGYDVGEEALLEWVDKHLDKVEVEKLTEKSES